MPTLDPASIARRIAGDVWGHPVLSFSELVPGVFTETPGHGGIVAILAVADLPERAVQAARVTGRLRQLEGVGEVWVAEEDCENKALLWSCPAVLDAAELVLLVDADYALEVAEDCCADFVAAYRALVR